MAVSTYRCVLQNAANSSLRSQLSLSVPGCLPTYIYHLDLKKLTELAKTKQTLSFGCLVRTGGSVVIQASDISLLFDDDGIYTDVHGLVTSVSTIVQNCRLSSIDLKQSIYAGTILFQQLVILPCHILHVARPERLLTYNQCLHDNMLHYATQQHFKKSYDERRFGFIYSVLDTIAELTPCNPIVQSRSIMLSYDTKRASQIFAALDPVWYKKNTQLQKMAAGSVLCLTIEPMYGSFTGSVAHLKQVHRGWDRQPDGSYHLGRIIHEVIVQLDRYVDLTRTNLFFLRPVENALDVMHVRHKNERASYSSITVLGLQQAFQMAHTIKDHLKDSTTVVFCASYKLCAQQTALCVYHHLSRLGIVKLSNAMDASFEYLVVKRSYWGHTNENCGHSQPRLCFDDYRQPSMF